MAIPSDPVTHDRGATKRRSRSTRRRGESDCSRRHDIAEGIYNLGFQCVGERCEDRRGLATAGHHCDRTRSRRGNRKGRAADRWLGSRGRLQGVGPDCLHSEIGERGDAVRIRRLGDCSRMDLELAKIPMVTGAPPTGFPLKSLTRTVTGGLIAAPAVAFDGCRTNAMSTKALTVFVRPNAAGVATPVVLAVTL